MECYLICCSAFSAPEAFCPSSRADFRAYPMSSTSDRLVINGQHGTIDADAQVPKKA